jgi:hypothetical protein
MFALCATQDDKVGYDRAAVTFLADLSFQNQKKTFDMIADGSVKEQDVFYFFVSSSSIRALCC